MCFNCFLYLFALVSLMKTLNNTTTESNDILSYGVGLKHVAVGGTTLNKYGLFQKNVERH